MTGCMGVAWDPAGSGVGDNIIIIIVIKVLQQHKEKYEHNKGDDDFMEMLKAYY